MENKKHRENRDRATTDMRALNQDMAFVNDHLEDTKSVTNFTGKKKKTD